MNRKIAILLLLTVALVFRATAQVAVSRPVTLMGSRFDITIVANNKQNADRYIDTVIVEIARIENLISDWKPESQISVVNLNAGVAPVKVDREVFNLTKRALEFSKISGGAFDISHAAMDKIWRFDGTMVEMPSADEIAKSVAKVGYHNIILDSLNSTIFLKIKGMKIGFGATGKGYAADRGRAVIEAKGAIGGIVNASGDMCTWGVQPNGKPWNVGIVNPFDSEKYLTILPFRRNSVTTSGSYEKFVELNGTRYSHIINPVTGYPATGLISVTVIGPSAEIANALSTSIMVLGSVKGFKLLNNFNGYSAVLVDDTGKIIKSEQFKGKVRRNLKGDMLVN